MVAPPPYDSGGKVNGDQTYGYVYNAQGNVCAAHTASGMIGYVYDAAGHRVAKGMVTSMTCDLSANGFVATNTYLLGPDGETMTEVDGGTWVETHVRANGGELATYNSTGIHFQIHDWLGTRRVQTDASGTPEDFCSGQPFGDGENCTNQALEASNYFFTGKKRDPESGLDYFGARYYGSSMGRWMSPDWDSDPFPVPYASLEDPQTLNLYSYVQNNPLSRRDTDGHASWQDCNGGTQQCWQGDYQGERDCSGSLGCLFWNQNANSGAGEWQGNDPTPPPPNDPAGDAITGFARMTIAHSWGDFNYGARVMFGGYARAFQNGPTPLGVGLAVVAPLTVRMKKPNVSGKDGAKDIPSWAAGSGPQGAEDGKQYASRMMDAKYGAGNWATSSQEFSQLKKYGDRAFVPAEPEPAPEPPIEPIP